MSNSQHQTIVTAAVALLTAGTPLCGGRVYEGREYHLASTDASQIRVFLDESIPSAREITGAPVDWTTTVVNVIKSRRTSGATSAEQAADAIWVDVWARVMADQSLGGLVAMLDPQAVIRDRDEADTDLAVFTWRYIVQHRTSSNVIT